MKQIVAEKEAVQIGNRAFTALLEEVYTSPKPGLVDLYSNGAHQDMNVRTFERSAAILRPFFVEMALQGLEHYASPETLFVKIRKTGQRAERAMYRGTGGVNTHKGAIFTLGLFSAAAGCCLAGDGVITKRRLRDIQTEMTEQSLGREIRELRRKRGMSHGEKNFLRYGTLGIRGEAIRGYPCLWEVSLPVFRQGIAGGWDPNSVKLQTLLTLMSKTEDYCKAWTGDSAQSAGGRGRFSYGRRRLQRAGSAGADPHGSKIYGGEYQSGRFGGSACRNHFSGKNH